MTDEVEQAWKEIMYVFKNSDAGHAITKMRLSINGVLILLWGTVLTVP